ncbi:MAG: hypothetical protein V1846_01410 [Candidatus Komeilibacteria bacterium]
MQQPIQYQGQQGAVLVLALLILSFVMFTALSLTSVLLVELRSAKYLDSAIIAHYAAESGAEKALFKLKEAHSLDELTVGLPSASDPYADFFNLEETSDYVLSGVDQDRSFTFNSISESSENFSAYNIPVNQSIQLDIFNPKEETLTTINTGATQLNIDWSGISCITSDRLEVSLLEFKNSGSVLEIVNSANNPRREYWPCGTCSDGSAPCADTTHPTVNSGSYYRISIRPIDHDVRSLTVTLSAADGSLVSIPSQVYIQTTGRFRDATQVVTVQTPWNSGVADIFNYVIFSESSLIKNVISQGTATFQTRCGHCERNDKIGCSSENDCTGLPTESKVCLPNIVGSTAYCLDKTINSSSEREVQSIIQNDYGQCNAKCNGLTYCGDGVKQGISTGGLSGDSINELCDDGNYSETDQCNNQCQPTYCGDGIIQGPDGFAGPNGAEVYEICDDGALNGTDGYCSFDCLQGPGGDGNGCGRHCPPPINAG